MRKLFLLLFLIPLTIHAQLDKLKLNISESEFQKSFPEALRNYDEEAYWTGGADTVNGIEGNSVWRVYKDTTDVYRFLTPKVEGPSSAYPNFDSTAVHAMKVCLDKVRAGLEAEFGKPDTYWNMSLKDVGLQGAKRAYFCIWKFPGSNNFIQLSISTDLSTGNYINAPGKYTVQESQSYEMLIEVSHRSDYTMLWYDLGKSSDRFFTIYKNFRAPLIKDRIYTMRDSAVSSNAEWVVKFYDSKLVSFQYSATTGTGYGSKSDAIAYSKLKAKCDKFIVEGEKTYGYADSIHNIMKDKYQPYDRQVVYNVEHLKVQWNEPDGMVKMKFEEVGGGKSPDTIFVLEVDFEPLGK